MESKPKISRREFVKRSFQISVGTALFTATGLAVLNASKHDYVWQIDPFKCTQCGLCETECVISPSAVKCVHAFDLCGYCNLCGGYFKPNANELATGAENQLCPTAAIERKFIEEPYFEYEIKEALCIGCAKCVKGCTSFGNGSLHLQIRHDVCVNCNECKIAKACPSGAIARIDVEKPYVIKGDFTFKNLS